MPSVTVTCEADASAWESPKYAAGVGNHLPVGHYGSADYHSILRFDSPSGWSAWTRITKATLNIYTSDFDHVGPRNSSIYVRRQSLTSGTSAPVWTGSEGSQSCESGFSTGTPDIDNMNSVTTGQASFSSGTTANAKKSIDVTTIVTYYRDAASGKMTFVLSPVGSGDYSEFWSRHKTGGYDITLVIDYEDNAPPTAPTQYGPSGTVVPVRPVFDWSHNDPNGDAQAGAKVRIWNSTGSAISFEGAPWNVAGSTTQLTAPLDLSRGNSYMWDVATTDADGVYGPWSAKKAFTIKANPVVTITATRFMSMVGGAPRLTVKWGVSGGTQKKYLVTAPGYSSGWLTSTATSHVLSTLALTNGTAVTITVTIETTDVLQDSDARSFTPRWGLTTHRRYVGPDAVTGWGTPTVSQTVPSGASLVVEYGSSASSTAPSTWYSALASVPKNAWVFWRAWFIPSATTGPTLHSIVIPVNFAGEAVDHWHATQAANTAITAPFSVDTGEYVYGSRSITCENSGNISYSVFSKRIKVRAGRSYILTGLMRAEGNAGTLFELWDADAGLLSNTTGDDIQSDILTASREWFEAGQLDVYRYRTPIWVAPSDMEVQVRLRSNGVAGTQSWWDALKLEESTVATPWNPAAVGAVILDAGGIQIDGTKGGVFRIKGTDGVTLEAGGNAGLILGGDLQLRRDTSSRLMMSSLGATEPRFGIALSAAHNSGSSGFFVWNSGDSVPRTTLGKHSGGQAALLLGPGGSAGQDVILFRESVGVLGLAIGATQIAKLGGSSTYQSFALFSGGTLNGGTLIDHGTASGIQGRIMAYPSGAGGPFEVLRWDSTTAGRIGFYGEATGGSGNLVVGRQTVAGARGGNVALTNLLTALHQLGLINNTTT